MQHFCETTEIGDDLKKKKKTLKKNQNETENQKPTFNDSKHLA